MVWELFMQNKILKTQLSTRIIKTTNENANFFFLERCWWVDHSRQGFLKRIMIQDYNDSRLS